MAPPRGSIADIEARLMLWAVRESADLVRVEVASEFSRQKVWQTVKTGLMKHGVSIHEVTLIVQPDPEIVVQALIDRLAELSPGVVSITGFSGAFANSVSLPEAQAVLNFNRDRYIHPGLRQIWWMTPTFLHTAVHTMPDLNSWFSYKLQLTEVLPLANEEITSEPIDFSGGVYANINDAYQRAHSLLLRFREAQALGTGEDLNLLITYLLPALEALAEVGAHQKLADLTLQFEGLLGQLQVSESLEVAIALARIATLYQEQGRYAEAEPLYTRSLEIIEKQLGAEHPSTANRRSTLSSRMDSMWL